MAKKTAHQDALGAYESFRAPWETEGGEDAEIDKAKLKRLIYNVKLDYAKSRDAHDDVKASLEEVEADLEKAKEEAADANGPEAQKKIDKLQKKVDDLTAERDGLLNEKEVAEVRKEVLGEFEALHPKAAKYVKGETQEELEASLKEVAEDWGIDLDNLDGKSGGGDDDDDDDDTDDDGVPTVRTTPRTRTLVTPGDKGGKGVEQEYDFDKVAEDAIGSGSPFG